MQRNEIKIVSGGQTGVDRGGLQAAIDLGLDWGGWAPKGWRAENGTIPPLYREKMREHASANYLGRTRRNVVDSHATLIITNEYPLSGGTLKTRFFCQEAMRSHFVISLGDGAGGENGCRVSPHGGWGVAQSRAEQGWQRTGTSPRTPEAVSAATA